MAAVLRVLPTAAAAPNRVGVAMNARGAARVAVGTRISSCTRPRHLSAGRPHPAGPSHHRRRSRRLLVTAPASATGDISAHTPGVLGNGFLDYYEILQVDDDADLAEIKSAYRSLAKVCHPDKLGDRGHDICILLNEAYQVLSDPRRRAAYNIELEQALIDTSDGYTGRLLSKWMAGTNVGKNEDPAESRGVFVDENTCIGCKMCVWNAPNTFGIEPEFGRSRVMAQWLDSEDDISTAIESCPVSCIHWVEKEELPALEHVMQNELSRVSVGAMMAGQGGAVSDVFDATQRFLKQRREREEMAQNARKTTPEEAASRRAVAEDIANLGWFASTMRGFMNGMANNVVSGPSSTRVGGRRRDHRWEDDAGENGATVPQDRALVPVRSESDSGYRR